MRLTIDLPDEWSQVLRQAAVGAGYKSVSEYVRSLIENAPGVATALAGQTLPPLHRSWGKSKVAEVQQDTEVTEHTEVKDKPDAPQVSPVPKAAPPQSTIAQSMHGLVRLTPEQVLAQAAHKAAGAHKGLPKSKNGQGED